MTKPTIGFVGLGIMGLPMAGHLLRAGYPMVVHDRIRSTVQEMVSAGAGEAFTPRDVAQQCQVVITMLPDSPDVELVALGADGLIEGFRPGAIYVDMSSIAPAVPVKVARALEVHGIRCLDAPVSGGQVGAVNATLSIMVGGDGTVLDEVRPILELVGKTVTLCGPNGAGQTVKACNQIQVGSTSSGWPKRWCWGQRPAWIRPSSSAC